MSTPQPPSSPLKYPLQWLAATIASSPIAAIGAIVGVGIGYRIQTDLNVDPFPLSLQAIIGFVFFGAITASAQWLVLRALVRDAWHWIPLSALAFPVAFQAADIAVPQRLNFEGVLSFMLLSAIQWLFFRTRARRAFLWVAFHTAFAIAITALPELGGDFTLTLDEALLGVLLTGVLFAVPGAAAVAFMFRPSNKGNVAPPNNSMEPTRPAAAKRV